MSAQPPIPQRPARSQDAPAPSPVADGPKIPPRPTRKVERSISRDREIARSPLNDSPFASGVKQELLHPDVSPNNAPGGLKRNPSVPSLPLIGQEGMEYASLDDPPEVARPLVGTSGAAPHQVSNVAHDLPLHAPKASDAPGASLTKISAVTGQHKQKDGEHSPALQSPLGKSRPPSVHTPHERAASRESHHLHSEDEHGIPSFGATVPMYPNAGDVQAPGLPSGSSTPTTGVGFFHGSGSRPTTADGRRRSLQHNFHGPPGSYGLHGHGQLPHDRFEKDWYARHPEEVAKEEHALHVPAAFQERPAYAMSSEELNQLVRETSRPGSGMGLHGDKVSIPSEAIGYQASEDYTRTHPPSGMLPEKIKARHSRPPSVGHVDSPLRKTLSAQDIVREEEKHHIDPPAHRVDKIGGAGYDPPLEDLGPKGGNTKLKSGWIIESGTGTPILASDEIAKHPGAEYLQPAISPSQMLSEDDYFSAHEGEQSPYRTKSRSRSRPESRDLSRMISHDHDGVHTPLEDIEEYEPLFEDDDDKVIEKPLTAADRLKRPELDKRRFPSQDIWEDTPTSLQLETTVDSPQEAVAREVQDTKASAAFETPEAEQLRRGEVTESERLSVLQELSNSKPKTRFGAHLREERPGIQRFPSQDIWEDTPDSLRLETTVHDLPPDEQTGVSPPKVPARPARTKAEEVSPQAVSVKAQRAGPPPISDKPKPVVPQRPGRSPQRDQSSRSPEEGPAAAKTKPAVPARPAANSKFASIKAGFLSDLNSRIGLGPQAAAKPKEEEDAKPEEDKAPLGDARRGRARGPARRKPAASPGTMDAEDSQVSGWAIKDAWTVWSISTLGAVDLSVESTSESKSRAPVSALKSTAMREHVLASPLSSNTAGESLQNPLDAPATSAGALAHAPSTTMDARAHRESTDRKEALREFEEQRVGHAGDVPSPIPEPYVEARSTGAPKEVTATPTIVKKQPLVTEAPTSPLATVHKSPMDVVMDDESAARSSEGHTGDAKGID